MPSSHSNSSGTPRIQISLSKDQRKSIAAASASSGNSDSDGSNAKKTIHSTIAANPVLYKSVRKALKNQSLNFKINVECTSLKVSPSGNFLWGGFSDGTLRVWDLSGTFLVEDDDVVASRQKTDVLVNSKLSQGYGAVACQIHARGVHTDLITTIDISDDAQYVFVGVARGAMELHAVFVGDLERAVHTHKQNDTTTKRNILDYIKVYCHSDAKLKGFGACATMTVASTSEQQQHQGSPSSYLLLTGKGIKNLHIWKFTPPELTVSEEVEIEDVDGRKRKKSICDPPEDEEDEGTWDQLYDTSTNGNTIVLLGFYRNPLNKLLAVSKSDAQKLRLWDLSFEEDSASQHNERPKRPPYVDVANSQSALEIAGGIGVCGGGNMYNTMSIVSLDRPNDPFNHTELALPSAASQSDDQQAYSSRRQRRGEMKAVVNVATSQRDSSHALLELDDGSLVGYSAGSSSSSKDSSGSIPRLAIATPESTGIPALPADFWRRCICLANIAGVVIAASSLYNPNTNKGQLVIRALGGLKKPRGSEVKEKKNKLKLLKQQQKQREQEKKEREKKRQAVAPPNTPSPVHNNPQSSPVAADASALRDAVSGPKAVPVSVLRTNKKPISTKAGKMDGSNTTALQSSSSSASLTRVSPNGVMETPRQPLNGTHEQDDDSPDSTQGLPKISKFLQPKRIALQAQNLKETSKKRTLQQSEESAPEATIPDKEPNGTKRARSASIVADSTAIETPQVAKNASGKVLKAAPTTSDSPMPMFQLNSIGSVPFKSPKPQANRGKTVGAPSKPKKTTNPVIVPNFSTPKTSRDATVNDSKTKSESQVDVPTKPSEGKPVAKISSAFGEGNRDRQAAENADATVAPQKIARTNDDVSTAMLLTALASPKPAENTQQRPVDEKAATIVTPKLAIAVVGQTKTTVKSTSKPKTPADSGRSKLASPLRKISISASKSKRKSTTTLLPNPISSREVILHEKIAEQYKQLRAFLKGITDRSMAFIHSRNMRGPVPSALASGGTKSDTIHLNAYSKLLTEHRAAHDYLQRRLLRSAETTLRLLLESRITAEEARSELKQSIKKFEEILYDTLRRQEVERLAVVAQHHGNPANLARGRSLPSSDGNGPLEATKEQPNYPCKEAFDKIDDICAAIGRPVGRPRSALAALR